MDKIKIDSLLFKINSLKNATYQFYQLFGVPEEYPTKDYELEHIDMPWAIEDDHVYYDELNCLQVVDIFEIKTHTLVFADWCTEGVNPAYVFDNDKKVSLDVLQT